MSVVKSFGNKLFHKGLIFSKHQQIVKYEKYKKE